MENEIWKVYKETYNNRWGKRIYEVSNLGNVKLNGVIVDFPKKSKYYIIGKFFVHRAVAELFIPNPENKPFVDHINGEAHDNRAINLRWCTYQENNNNPITKQRQSVSQKRIKNSPEYKAKYNSVYKAAQNRPEVKEKHHIAMKNRPWMTNGINEKHPKPEYINYWIERGYHFGRK